jgi:hypothetical protein
VPTPRLHVNDLVTPTTRTRLAFFAVLVVLGVLAAAGCGSSKSSSTTTTSENAAASRTNWANSVCGPLVTWKSTMKSIGQQLKGSTPSKSSLQSAAKQAESATQTLVNDLKAVGKPPTPAADQAKKTVDQLESELTSDAGSIKSTASNVSGVQSLSAAAKSVKATVSTMRTQVSSAVSQLKSLGPNGEWQQAFSQAQNCKTLSSS